MIQTPTREHSDSKGMFLMDKRFETADAIAIRAVIEKYSGVFMFSPNVKLFCNFCQEELKKYERKYVQQHLNSEEHIRNFTQKQFNKEKERKKTKNRCFALVTNELVLVSDDEDEHDPQLNKVNLVIKAFNDGIFANGKFDKIHCTVCKIDIHDSFLLLKKHLSNKDHTKKKLRKRFSNRIIDFVEQNPCLEFDGQLVHCKLCKKVIQAKHFNLVRHCSLTFHQAMLKDALEETSPENEIVLNENKSEKNQLDKLVEQNNKDLIFYQEKLLCKPCKKILVPNYFNVLKHINRVKHKEKVNMFDPSTSLENIIRHTITNKTYEELLQMEQNKLDRLLMDNDFLVYYNQKDNILCKPCKKVILSKYINVKNHLRRQCHNEKLLLYQQERETLSTAIEQITNDTIHYDHYSTTGPQTIIIEQVEMDHESLVQSDDTIDANKNKLDTAYDHLVEM